MNCLEFRRLTLIDPGDVTPARQEHEKKCAACAKFAEHLRHQDELIRQATRVEVPDGFAARIKLNQSLQSQSRRPTRTYWLSLAASFLLAVALLPAIIEETYYKPFDEELIAHVGKHDVLAADRHNRFAGTNKVSQVLASVNTAMPENPENIIYASTCVVEGITMAHLLVKNGDNEYVVFLMPQRTFLQRSINLAQYSGLIASRDHGSIAVMNHTGADVAPATEQFKQQFSKQLVSGTAI